MPRPPALFAALLVLAPRLPAQVAPSAFMGHGISHELAAWRARTVSDVRYNLIPDSTAPDSAVGRVGVRFSRRGDSDVILDFRGRRLGPVTANGSPVGQAVFNGHHLRIPASLLRAGENLVDISFVAEIAPSGASIIKVHDPADRSDYLYTLLVPADANQLEYRW